MRTLSYLRYLVAIALTSMAVPVAAADDPPPREKIVAVDHVVVPSGTYVNDMTHTQLFWRVQHSGMAVYSGRMDGLNATLEFDAENPANTSITVSVDPMTVDTGYVAGERDWDNELATRADFFNASAHPEITFSSDKVTMTGPRTATVSGTMTLLGVSRPVAFDARFNGSLKEHFHFGVPMLGFSAKGSFDRTTFGLDYGAGGDVSSVVEIEMQVEFIKKEG